MKTGSIEGELRSNGAAATQNRLENTTADIWEYRTKVAVEWFFRDYFETIGGFRNIVIHHLASLRDF